MNTRGPQYAASRTHTDKARLQICSCAQPPASLLKSSHITLELRIS